MSLTCHRKMGILTLMGFDLDERQLYNLIGLRIKELRGQRRQEELAVAIGMLRTSVANIESGRQKTPLHVLYRVCAFLNVEPAVLLPSLIEVVKSQNLEIKINDATTKVTPKTAVAITELKKLLDDGADEEPI